MAGNYSRKPVQLTREMAAAGGGGGEEYLPAPAFARSPVAEASGEYGLAPSYADRAPPAGAGPGAPLPEAGGDGEEYTAAPSFAAKTPADAVYSPAKILEPEPGVFFQGSLDRLGAERKLKGAPGGAFVVRGSSSPAQLNLAVSYVERGTGAVQHLKLYAVGSKWTDELGQQHFVSVAAFLRSLSYGLLVDDNPAPRFFGVPTASSGASPLAAASAPQPVVRQQAVRPTSPNPLMRQRQQGGMSPPQQQPSMMMASQHAMMSAPTVQQAYSSRPDQAQGLYPPQSAASNVVVQSAYPAHFDAQAAKAAAMGAKKTPADGAMSLAGDVYINSPLTSAQKKSTTTTTTTTTTTATNSTATTATKGTTNSTTTATTI